MTAKGLFMPLHSLYFFVVKKITFVNAEVLSDLRVTINGAQRPPQRSNFLPGISENEIHLLHLGLADL